MAPAKAAFGGAFHPQKLAQHVHRYGLGSGVADQLRQGQVIGRLVHGGAKGSKAGVVG